MTLCCINTDVQAMHFDGLMGAVLDTDLTTQCALTQIEAAFTVNYGPGCCDLSIIHKK